MIHPRVLLVPECESSLGREAVDLAASYGVMLDPWQAFVLEHSLGITEYGKWAAFGVGLCVARQNGKGEILLARQLAGLFLAGEKLITHTAHQFDTSLDALRRLENVIQNNPDLHKRVKPRGYKHSHGHEGIELRNGQQIRFRTRTKGGGRGFTADCVIFDEAMILPASTLSALLYTLSAVPNPQLWYAGSAVDRQVHEHGQVFSSVRERGVRGEDGTLAYFEWSAGLGEPAKDDPSDPGDLDEWERVRMANPAIGIRISEDYIRKERAELELEGGVRSRAVERYTIGDWHKEDAPVSHINLEAWAEAVDPGSKPRDPVCFAFDVTPRRTYASIAVAGFRADGLPHVEIVDRRPGTGWVPQRLEELVGKHRCSAVAYAKNSPAESLIPDVELLPRVSRLLVGVTTAEHAAACGRLFDLIEQRAFRHMGVVSPFGAELDVAVAGAFQKEHGDKFLWSRSKSAVDISPLVAATLALYEVAIHAGSSAPMVAFA